MKQSDQDNGKQGVFSLFKLLLDGPYALLALFGCLVYLFLQLTPVQLDRLKELIPIFNSSPGIAMAIILVVSYLGSIFVRPLKELTHAILQLKDEFKNSLVELRGQISGMVDTIEEQHIEIIQQLKDIKKFYTGGD